MTVNKGDKVVIEYEGKLDNGQVFDASERHGQPLAFEVGSGMVIPGFDSAVIGMEIGQEKEFHIDKKDAYGEKNPELKKEIPKNSLPADQKIEAGMTLIMQNPQGQRIPLKVEEVKDDVFVIDLNHPLAGHNLNFKIKVVDVNPE